MREWWFTHLKNYVSEWITSEWVEPSGDAVLLLLLVEALEDCSELASLRSSLDCVFSEAGEVCRLVSAELFIRRGDLLVTFLGGLSVASTEKCAQIVVVLHSVGI